jgi:uncharacterized protein (TIGR03067 family)
MLRGDLFMRFIIIRAALLLFVASLATAAEDKPASTNDDAIKALQGKWRLVSVEQNEQANEVGGDAEVVFLVHGNGIVLNDFKLADFHLPEGVANPKLIDVKTQDQSVLEGVYEINGDTWRVCINNAAQEKSKERPTELSTRGNPNYQLFTFKREAG